MQDNKNFLISGLNPNEGGTGDFFSYLILINNKNNYNYHIIFPVNPIQSKNIFKKIYNFFIKKIFYKKDYNGFQVYNLFKKIKNIYNSEVILLHPQTLGYRIVLQLLKNNNKIKYYVLDNSFFCIRSYNYHSTQIECRKCLGFKESPFEDCMPFPISTDKELLLFRMKQINNYLNSITFYTQNKYQTKLLEFHFTKNINVKQIGMWTDSLNQLENYYPQNHDIFKRIVFHGSIHEAKGFKFITELAIRLPDIEIIIPIFPGHSFTNIPKNIIYKIMNWETGLKDLIETSYLTICPSLWSAANEAALIKSILIAPKVAVVDLEFGFNREISNDLITKLDKDIHKAVNQISNIMSNFEPTPFELRKNWLDEYYSKCDMESLFK